MWPCCGKKSILAQEGGLVTLNMGHHRLSCPSASILARTAPKQGAAYDGACKVVSDQRELAKSISGVL